MFWLGKCHDNDMIRSLEKYKGKTSQKSVFVEDLNSLEKEKSFGGSRSVVLCFEVLRKAIFLQYFTNIFLTRSTKSGHEIYFFTFEKYIIRIK